MHIIQHEPVRKAEDPALNSDAANTNATVPFPDPDTIATDAADVSHALEAIAKDIEQLQSTAIMKIAKRLADAHELFRYRRDEGGFGGWVETRLGISKPAAYNLLHVHEEFGAGESVKILDRFRASVLYLLAAPSTPDAAKAEIFKRAEDGEAVSVAEAKAVIKDAREAAEGKAEDKPERKSRSRVRHRKEPASAERRNRSESKSDKLNSLAWSTATPDARRKFLEAIGFTSWIAATPEGWVAKRAASVELAVAELPASELLRMLKAKLESELAAASETKRARARSAIEQLHKVLRPPPMIQATAEQAA